MRERSHIDLFTWLPLEQARLVIESIRETPTPGSAVTPCAEFSAAEREQYLAGTVDAALAQRVLTHLTTCDACRQCMSVVLQAGDAGAPDTATPTLGRGQLDALFATLEQREACPETTSPELQLPSAEEHEHEC